MEQQKLQLEAQLAYVRQLINALQGDANNIAQQIGACAYAIEVEAKRETDPAEKAEEVDAP